MTTPCNIHSTLPRLHRSFRPGGWTLGLLGLAAATLTATAAPYNGTQPTGAKNLQGKTITVTDVPKIIGIGYFDATAKGIKEAADELSKKEKFNVTTDGPTEGDISKQVEFLDNAASSGVDGLLFAANDPVAISPVLRKALKQGITVVGYDADSEPDARTWFVQMAAPDGVAKALIDSMVKQTGPEADIAIVTSSLTAPGQNAWIAEIKKYLAASFPKLNIVTTLPSEEDQQLAFNKTGEIIKAYPNVKGIIGLSSVAGPGVADAVTRANLIGKVAVVSLSTPNQMKPFIKSGCVKYDVLWNPVDLGYAASYVMRAAIDGTLKPGDTEFSAGRLGKLQIINGSQILLGAPTIFTKENVDNFNF